MKKIMAIYDSDVIYATRFMELFQKRKEFDFDFSAFTKKESLEEYSKNNQIEILLLGDGLKQEEIPKENIKHIYNISEHPIYGDNVDIPTIFKYQPAQDIMSEVISDYVINEKETKDGCSSGNIRIISVFSPIQGSTKLSFAWSLSLILSEKRKVLFIPFDLLPVPLLSMVDQTNQATSEFIYYLKENNPNIHMKMKSLLRYIGKLAYLEGLSHGLDLLSISKEDLCKWIDVLREQSDYEIVVFYCACYSEAMVELIRQSNQVIVTLQENAYESAVSNEWERQMNLIGLNKEQMKFQTAYMQEEERLMKMGITLSELQESAAWSCARQYEIEY